MDKPLSLLAFVIIGLVIGALLLWPKPTKLQEKANRIHQGMTVAEVETIIGRQGIHIAGTTATWTGSPPTARTLLGWSSDDSFVSIYFDDQDRVVGAPMFDVHPGPIELMLRRWRLNREVRIL
jgi:hypothetical protein